MIRDGDENSAGNYWSPNALYTTADWSNQDTHAGFALGHRASVCNCGGRAALPDPDMLP